MIKIKRIIGITFAFLVIHIPSAFAQLSTNVTELTKPVGGNILPGGSSFQGDIKTSFIFAKLIPFAIKYTIRLAVAFSVIALILGGYQYMTAYGDDEKHGKAKKTIIWAVVGLILAITAFGIVKIITTIQFT